MMTHTTPVRLITASLFTAVLAACSGGSIGSLKGTHVHGLAVDRGDSGRIYLATHNGLYAVTNDRDIDPVGTSWDDYMGFSPHPTDPRVLFTSGHLKGSGNIGFQRSDDGGETWRKISNGHPSGPADFHAMLVHPANPDHVYGWYKLRVHRSLDGGRTWEVLPKQPPEILSFAGNPENENVLYAGSIGDLLMSGDRGESWTSMTDAIGNDVVFDLEVDPSTDALLLTTRDRGILRVTGNPGGGVTVEEVGKLPDRDVPEHFALDPRNPETMYSFSKAQVLYKSTDGGRTWLKIL